MAANKVFNFGPVIMSAVLTTNILNPPTAAGGVGAGASGNYIVIRHVRIINKTGVAATASLWKGATGANAAGTEILAQGLSVPANSGVDFYGQWRFDVADFLVGGSGTAAALTIEGEGEIGVAG